MGPNRSARSTVRRLAWALLGLLVIENLLGIFANLYIEPPSGNAMPSIFTSFPVLAAHVLNGFLMVGLASTALVVAHRAGYRRIRNAAAAELAFLTIAIQEGFAFAATQNEVFSFGMDSAFLLAVVAVAGILYRVGPPLENGPTQGFPTNV